jgi:hypothetical protein
MSAFPALVEREQDYITEARGLFDGGFYSYALLAFWNAAVNNLKRRVEAYGAGLWQSVVKDEPGRKKYDKDGETIAERWSSVDDLVLISGASRLGLLNPKAGKALEMINWMRNHASPAHDSDSRVEQEDVIGLILLLQKNLFEQPLPDVGHSVSSIFDPVKDSVIDAETLDILKDQIRSFRVQDTRVCFGFFTDLVSKGETPSAQNAASLFPAVWDKAGEDLRKTLGLKYHTLIINPDSDDSKDKSAKTRIFELLLKLDGVSLIPDGTRARLYRRAADALATAKNAAYGWTLEESASRGLLQLGTIVPSVAFEQVYQEVIATWCGNYWGRSGAQAILAPFIENLNSDQIRSVLRMFRQNARVRDELGQNKPKKEALALLRTFDDKLTVEAHKQELKDTIKDIKTL